MARLTSTIAKPKDIGAKIGAKGRAIGGKSNGNNWHRLAPIGRGEAIPAKRFGTDAKKAISEFLAVMDGEIGGAALAFSVWREAYADLAKTEGWPSISDRTLGLALQAAGCRRRMVDGRKAGKGRFVVYQIIEAA